VVLTNLDQSAQTRTIIASYFGAHQGLHGDIQNDKAIASPRVFPSVG
jgi:hypothetical protein